MKTYVFLFILTVLSFSSGAKMTTSALAITSVQIKTSNASLGPHNVIRTWTLGVSNKEFKELSQKVMQESKLNGKYSLNEYFEKKDKIEPRKPVKSDEPRPKGAGSRTTTLYFNNGEKIEFNSYYDYYLTPPFDQLVQLTQKTGNYDEYKADDGPSLRSEDILNPPPTNQPRKIKTH